MQNLRNLFNQALTAVGGQPEVTDPAADDKATLMCRLWFDVARRDVFTAFHWSSLRVARRLSRINTRSDDLWVNGDPEPGFSFSYSLPTDCLQPQYMADFSRFKTGRIGDSLVIFSNAEQPILHYTRDCLKPELWSADLYLAVVYSLAAKINTAKNGKLQMTQKLERMVYEKIEFSATAAANEDDTYFESVPGSWAGTGFSVPHNSVRYYYPTSTFRISAGDL